MSFIGVADIWKLCALCASGSCAEVQCLQTVGWVNCSAPIHATI